MSDDSNVTPDSTYPPLEPPGEFKSQIPEHLMKDASATDRYMMEQMSIMKQYSDWSVKANLGHDRNIRTTNGRLRKAEAEIEGLKDDKRSFISGWRAIAAVAGIISGVVSFLVLLYQAFNGAAP